LQVTTIKRPTSEATSRSVKILGVLRFLASLRTRQRKDGTVYTSVLYVHQGKQSSSSFNDHAEALEE